MQSLQQETEIDSSGNELEEASKETETKQDKQATTIFVQVAGAVNKPGVYELPQLARVYQALDKAGGLLDDADDSDINQAALLTDGQKIYVYQKGERENMSDTTSETDSDLININTASAEELQQLPGIGATKAIGIVTYREENNGFSSIEDIKNVSGIGESIFSQIESSITI